MVVVNETSNLPVDLARQGRARPVAYTLGTGSMTFFDLLFMPATVLGAVVGTAICGFVAYALHTWWPGAYSVTLGALLVGGGLLVGAIIGSRWDLPRDGKNQ
ncbi:hypothetical protein CGK74_15445 [Thauera propionica]|uniref:Uncharacterized protein n=1 Tax=Thauera propionica TaxID=2019431 RepID=A0A235EV40_9RHOO|nr:hypothetical protein CGK74_15445 [Thauera propionica]